jgi:hypothetical protein
MVVPEYSATLGFPDEDSVALNGDHLSIAKYSSKKDPNFVKIATRLHRLVAEFAKATEAQAGEGMAGPS